MTSSPPPELPHAVTCPTCLAWPTLQVLICPTCGERDTAVVWVGATARYGDHTHPDTGERCETVGGGIGSHNLAMAHPRKRSS